MAILLAGGAGYFHYRQNNKPESVVVLNSDANIRMYLNKEGKVVELKSDNEAGDALLESYMMPIKLNLNRISAS